MSGAAPEAFGPDELTEDRLLGGRVRLVQPRRGYRAATDPVLLAAAVAARPGERVLELGCGAGAALLCLAARLPGLELTGLELQPGYLALARRNADLNRTPLRLIQGDVADPPAALRAESFDRVMMNPPWHAAADAPGSPDPGRDRANREGAEGLAGWIDAGLRRLRPGGRLTLIQRAERLPDMLAAIGGRAGGIRLKPLVAREGRAAKRVILCCIKGARTPFRLESALVLHEGPAHLSDRDDFTAAARAILVDGAGLPLEEGV